MSDQTQSSQTPKGSNAIRGVSKFEGPGLEQAVHINLVRIISGSGRGKQEVYLR
jgi:hypothetical protein